METVNGQVAGGELARRAGDLDVAKTVVVETRPPALAALAFQCVVVGLELLIPVKPPNMDGDVRLVNAAFGVEHFAVAHGHFGASRPGEVQFRVAGEVLPDIEDKHARLRLGDGDGLDDLGDADW